MTSAPFAPRHASASLAGVVPRALLRVGISTRALFDLESEHTVFVQEGIEAYRRLQTGSESQLEIGEGAGFNTIQRLLKLNEAAAYPLVEVVILSRNSPDQALRYFDALARRGLSICNGSFTGGRPLGQLAKAWDLDLFLSNEATDVQAASEAGVSAAQLVAPSTQPHLNEGKGELRIAFDGDGVIFGRESDAIFAREGLDAFVLHETLNASKPMCEGPFARFLKALSKLRESTSADSRPRIALVTSRSAPTHERVLRTLREWNTPADEAHFVGRRDKASVLEAFGAHIFFDDRQEHVSAAAVKTAAGLVPGPA